MKKFLIEILKKLIQIPAAFVIRKFNPQIIAITGSAGKTTTKEAIYLVLKEKFGNEVRKSEGNLNTRLGLPLAVLGFKKGPSVYTWPAVLLFSFFKSFFIRKYPKFLVLEYAIDYPGEFKILTSFAKPKVAVITAVGASHVEFFKDIEGVFKEKSELVKSLDEDGFAVLNETNELSKKMAGLTKAKVIFFKADNLVDLTKEAAKKVGEIFGIEESESEKALSEFKMPEHRIGIKQGINNSIVIDDCYNANPVSMNLALDFLRKYEGKRKIAVLGDMLELGNYAEEAHKEVGLKARGRCDLLLTTGYKAKMIAEEGNGIYFKTKKELSDYLHKNITEGDIILIKASRGMKFEEIVDEIS